MVMAHLGDPAPNPNEPWQAPAATRYVYPKPLTQDDLEAMDGVLPDDVTAAHLRWLETGEGDPWGGSFG